MSKTYVSASLRKLVYERAQSCCEYCLIPEALTLAVHQIDHVIAEKHGGKTVAQNLALACSLCNMAKGSDIASIDPETGETERLYNPRQDRWSKHFRLDDDNGSIEPLTAIGRTTLSLLKTNRTERLVERCCLMQTEQLRIP